MTDQKTSTDWNNHFCCVLCRITKTFAISWQCKKVPLGRILVFSTTFQPPPKRLNYDIWHRAIWDFCESNNDLPIICGDQASLNLRYLKNNNLYLWCNAYQTYSSIGKKQLEVHFEEPFLLYRFFKKWANPGLFFVYFGSFSNQHHYNFYNKYMWKKFHRIYGAGIQTHDLQNVNLNP